MTGFRNFILRGNLVELAVAFIIGVAFATVVNTFTDVVTGTIARVFGANPNFDAVTWFKNDDGVGVPVGPFFTAVVAFLIMAAVLYFLVVLPYTAAKERLFPREPEGTPADVALLTEIRDLLRARGGADGV